MRRVAADGGRASVSERGGGGIRRLTLGAGLAFLVGLAATASQADTGNTAVRFPAPPPSTSSNDKKDDKKATDKKTDDKTDDKKPERRIAFSMDGKPWASVFTWLTEQTGKPVISTVKPTGTLSFIGPAKKMYTMPEVIDIINEALLSGSQTQKYYLINGERSFTLIPADEKVDPALIPRIRPEQLADHGRTELVSVILPLKSLVAEDFANEVVKMMGPFGTVTALVVSNKLLVLDTVGNIVRIQKTIEEIEKEDEAKANQLSHKCKWIKASEAERIIKELTGDYKAMIERATQGGGGDRGPRRPGGMEMMFGGGMFGGQQGGGGGGEKQSVTIPKRAHFITSNEKTNTILITGPANKVSDCEAILKKIDVEQPGQKPILVGDPILKIYNVAPGTAEALAKTLQDAYKASSTCRISQAGNAKVLAYATPEDQEAIARQILSTGDKDGMRAITLDVGDNDPTKMAATLTGMFGDSKTGAPYVEALADKNAIIVRGTGEQVEEAKDILKAILGKVTNVAGTGGGHR